MAKGATTRRNSGRTRKPTEPEPEEVTEPEEVAEVTEPSGPELAEEVQPQEPPAGRMERFQTARPDGSMVEIVRNLDTGEQSVKDIQGKP